MILLDGLLKGPRILRSVLNDTCGTLSIGSPSVLVPVLLLLEFPYLKNNESLFSNSFGTPLIFSLEKGGFTSTNVFTVYFDFRS